MIKKTPGSCTAQLGCPLQSPPLALQRHVDGFSITPPHSEASPAATLSAPVGGDAVDYASHTLRQGVSMTVVLEPLGSETEMQRVGITRTHIGGHLLQKVDQCPLQRCRLLEAVLRSSRHPCVYKGGQHRIIAGDAQSLQIVEGASHALRAQARR